MESEEKPNSSITPLNYKSKKVKVCRVSVGKASILPGIKKIKLHDSFIFPTSQNPRFLVMNVFI